MIPTTPEQKLSCPDNDWVNAVCRPGRRGATCKYLMMGAGGWECAKFDTEFRLQIDRRTDMVAKCDNCEGRASNENRGHSGGSELRGRGKGSVH